MTLRESLRGLLTESDPWEGSPQDLWERMPLGASPAVLGRALATHKADLAAEGILVDSVLRGKDRKRMLVVSRIKQNYAGHLNSLGFNLVPLPWGRKQPVIPWKHWQTQRNTPTEIAQFRQGEQNLAIVTGAISGIVVVDLDSPQAWCWAKAYLPETPMVCLGSEKAPGWRGQHWYYKHPGQHVGNKVQIDGPTGKIDLDLRGDGGYVLAPGSKHPSGILYEAQGEWSAEMVANLPLFPLEAFPQPPAQPQTVASSVPVDELASRRMRELLASIPGEGKGNRDNKAFIVACKARDFTGDHSDGWEAFSEWCGRCTPPLPARDQARIWASSGKSAQNAPGCRLEVQPVPAKPAAINPKPAEEPRLPLVPANPVSAEPAKQPASQAKAAPEEARELPTQEKFSDEITGPDGYTNTDSGNAQRLAEFYRQDLRWVTDWKSWLVWDGYRWAQDEGNFTKVKLQAQELFEMLLMEHEEASKSFKNHLLSSLDSAKINAAITCLEFQKGIPTKSDWLDQGLHLFNTRNGTIDLNTGIIRPHRREDMLLKSSPVLYDPEATCPLWESFLGKITAYDDELQQYLQRVCGYTITGFTKEQCFFFLYGGGKNGKSTFLEVFGELMADYSRTANFNTFVEQKNDPGGVRTDIARLVGARYVVASESEAGKPLAMALIKTLTGQEKVTARFLYSKEFEFLPAFKLFLAGNYKPPIKDNSIGAWRRLHLIPFNVEIPEEERDLELKYKLFKELPGILNWAIKGCQDWLRGGLQPPRIVTEAVKEYQDDQDPIGQFLRSRCVTGYFEVYSCSAAELMREYQDYCEEVGERPWSQRALHSALDSRKFVKRRGTGGAYRWLGLGLKSHIPEPGQALQGQLDIPG